MSDVNCCCCCSDAADIWRLQLSFLVSTVALEGVAVDCPHGMPGMLLPLVVVKCSQVGGEPRLRRASTASLDPSGFCMGKNLRASEGVDM